MQTNKDMILKAKYEDKIGSIETNILNENGFLTMNLNGVFLKGSCPASLMIENWGDLENKDQERFSLTDEDGFLTNCRLTIDFPIKVMNNGCEAQANLKVDIGFLYEPGIPEVKLPVDQVWSEFSLSTSLFMVNTERRRYQFDDAFLDLKKKLPKGCEFKCCWNCKFSEYSDEQDYFGSLKCYKNHGPKFFEISVSSDFFDIEDNFESVVQEIYLCDAFISR